MDPSYEYNFTESNVTNHAYEKLGIPSNPFDYDNEANVTNYAKMNLSDDSRFITSKATADGEYDSQVFIFNISDDISIVGEVTKLNLTWEGYGETEAGYYTNISFWNWTAGAWYLVNSTDFTSAADLSISEVITSGASDFVNSSTGQVAVLVSSRKYVGVGGEYSFFYQEDANATVCIGQWCPICTIAYDGDWGTSGGGGASGRFGCEMGYFGYLYLNYTKPGNTFFGTLWQVKDGDGMANLTVSSACWNQAPLQLMAESDSRFDSIATYWKCYNGTDWETLRIANVNQDAKDVYEEGIFWNVSASPYIYIFDGADYQYLSDFIPRATSKEKEYTSFVDIGGTEIVDSKVKLKITEELDETTYLDRVYLRVDESEIIELGSISDADINLLRESDDEYLVMNEGAVHYLEFEVPDGFEKLEFGAEGYYIKHYRNRDSNPSVTLVSEENDDGTKEFELEQVILFVLLFIVLSVMLVLILGAKPLGKFVQFLKRKVRNIENIKIHWSLWLVSIFSIMFIRDFIENYMVWSDFVYPVFMRIEYFLFWVPIFISLTLFLTILTKENISKVAKNVIFFWWITLLPPIIDFILSTGKGLNMTYILPGIHNVSYQFFSFMDILHIGGPATIGIKVEIILACFFSMLYVLMKTKSKIKAVLTPLIVYSLIFFFFITPAFIPLLGLDIQDVYISMIPIHGILILMSLFFWFIFYCLERRKHRGFRKTKVKIYETQIKIKLRDYFNAIIKNIRPFRTIHYSALVVLGLAIGFFVLGNYLITTKILISLVFTIFAVFFGWLFAVFLNDMFDYKIDKVSNKNRPLVSGIISLRINKFLTFIFFLLSIGFSLLASYYVFSFVLLFNILYGFIYSAPPFRLKRFFIIPNIIIALCSLAAVMAGFAIISRADSLIEFPKNLLVLILIIYTISTTLKDIKDYWGDKQEGIKTIPTVFGLRRGKRIIGFLIALSFILVPIFFPVKYLMYVSIPFALMGYLFVVKKNEKWIFVLEFIFIVILLVLGSITGSVGQLTSEKQLKDNSLGTNAIEKTSPEPHNSLYTDYISLEVEGNAPPLTTINLPASTTYNTSSIDFNITLDEDGYCEYSLDSGVNNVTMTNNGNRDFNHTNSSIADNSYTMNAYCNDTSGNNNYTGNVTFEVDVYHEIYLSSDLIGNYQINGSINATITNGTTYTSNQFINFTHSTYGKRLQLHGLFSSSNVDLSNLTINHSATKVVVDVSSVSGIASNHTLFLPNNHDSAVYICPDATTL
ncbi:MAG: UbiA family prenyltransferase, partial [Nanoarchaeota archaeon]|nr:UbiA family prenyltransferase [Nanoarchaeota archaeon]